MARALSTAFSNVILPTLLCAALLPACSASAPFVPSDPGPIAGSDIAATDTNSNPVSVPVAFAPATFDDMEGAWQVEMSPGAFELLTVALGDRDNDGDGTPDGNRIEYEGPDFDQAGWRQVSVAPDGRLSSERYRGPGISAMMFQADRPFYTFLLGGKPIVRTDGETLEFRRAATTVRAIPHPSRDLAAPPGKMWVVNAYPFREDFKPYDYTVPPFNPDRTFADVLDQAIADATVEFSGYTAGVRAGCNGGGVAFAQTPDRFVPLSGVMMTQMACGTGGLMDAVAISLVREGPPFVRQGDTLVRDFPEGRMTFGLADERSPY